MITPSNALPRVATNATIADGDETGMTTRYNLGSSAIAAGFKKGTLVARFLNYLLGVTGDWLAWAREAMPVRLTDTPREFCIPTEAFCELTHAPSLDAAYVALDGSNLLGGTYQPVLYQHLTACYFMWQISDVLPKDAVLTSISIDVCGFGSWSALPTTMPKIYLVHRGTDGTLTTLSSIVTDSSANPTAWKLSHTLTISGLSQDLSLEGLGGRLYLVLEGAKDTTFYPTLYAAPRALVKSKTWV